MALISVVTAFLIRAGIVGSPVPKHGRLVGYGDGLDHDGNVPGEDGGHRGDKDPEGVLVQPTRNHLGYTE